MKKTLTRAALFLGLFSFALVGTAAAQGTTTQEVTVEVKEVNAFGPDGGGTLNAITLTIDSATPGEGLSSATKEGGEYAITTNGQNKKITGQLGAEYSGGITLNASLQAPDGASSTAKDLVATTARDLVTGISQQKGSNLTITYTASATLDVVPPTTEERTVTYTLTSN
jgi:hypothetical protein